MYIVIFLLRKKTWDKYQKKLLIDKNILPLFCRTSALKNYNTEYNQIKKEIRNINAFCDVKIRQVKRKDI